MGGVFRHDQGHLSLLEAALARASSVKRWGEQLVSAAEAVLQPKPGISWALWRHTVGLRPLSVEHVSRGTANGAAGPSLKNMLVFPARIQAAILSPGRSVSTMRRATSALQLPTERAIRERMLAESQCSDVVSAFMHPTSTCTIMFGWGLPIGISLTASDRRHLTWLSLHLQGAAQALLVAPPRPMTLSARGEVIEGHEDIGEVWRSLLEGRVMLVRRGSRRVPHYAVVATPARLWAQRRLSALEAAAMEGVASGLQGKTIAAQLTVSPSRLSLALGVAAAKLGAPSVFEALSLMAGLLPRPWAVGRRLLTPAEREVLEDLQAGLSNRAIGERRGRSVHTVANQVAAVLKKTGATGRRSLVAAKWAAGMQS